MVRDPTCSESSFFKFVQGIAYISMPIHCLAKLLRSGLWERKINHDVSHGCGLSTMVRHLQLPCAHLSMSIWIAAEKFEN